MTSKRVPGDTRGKKRCSDVRTFRLPGGEDVPGRRGGPGRFRLPVKTKIGPEITTNARGRWPYFNEYRGTSELTQTYQPFDSRVVCRVPPTPLPPLRSAAQRYPGEGEGGRVDQTKWFAGCVHVSRKPEVDREAPIRLARRTRGGLLNTGPSATAL